MRILEWSDTQLIFHIVEKSLQTWKKTDVDLTVYDRIVLEMKYKDEIKEYVWTVDTEWEWKSYVIFDIFSEFSIWKVWKISCDIRWIKDWWKKIRFNEETKIGDVLQSITIPQWSANE